MSRKIYVHRRVYQVAILELATDDADEAIAEVERAFEDHDWKAVRRMAGNQSEQEMWDFEEVDQSYPYEIQDSEG